MTPAIVTLVVIFLLLPVALACAQERVPDDFGMLSSRIKTDPSIAGQWSILLPKIAKQCGFEVDQLRVAAVINSFAEPDVVDEEADYYAKRSGRLDAVWEAEVMRDHDAACRLADGRWGETGSQYPGVLRDNAE